MRSIPDGCRGEAASKGVHEEMGLILADLTPVVNMAFFSLAGASLILVRLQTQHIAYPLTSHSTLSLCLATGHVSV